MYIFNVIYCPEYQRGKGEIVILRKRNQGKHNRRISEDEFAKVDTTSSTLETFKDIPTLFSRGRKEVGW